MLAAEAFDRLSEAVFGPPNGLDRLHPLIARHEKEVGLRSDDHEFDALSVARADWALCEAELEGPGDTWARRAFLGRVPGVTAAWAEVPQSSQVGLFEVYGGRATWLRGRLYGGVVRLLDELLPWDEGSDSVRALWELRVVPDATD